MTEGDQVDIQAVRDWAHEARPVFICGIERSGTSALQLALARHPALFAVPDVYETFVFTQPHALRQDPVPPMVASYLGGAGALAPFRAHYALDRLGDDDLIRAFFHFAAYQVYPGRRPLEKTPSHVRRLSRMCELFPHARIIICTREPAAVVASYRQRLAKEKALGLGRETWGWLDRGLVELADQCNAVGAHLRAAAALHGDRLFVAPYAWLTADAPAALAALCAFAGLAYEPALLAPRPRQASQVDVLLSQPIGPRDDADGHRPLSTGARQVVRELTAGLHPLWDTPGPLGRLKGAPPASA